MADTREAVRALFDGPNACGYWLENMLEDYERDAITDAVMAVLPKPTPGVVAKCVDPECDAYNCTVTQDHQHRPRPITCTCQRIDIGLLGESIAGLKDPHCPFHGKPPCAEDTCTIDRPHFHDGPDTVWL